MKQLYLIGGGGHCRSCIDVIEQENKYKIMGIFDKIENIHSSILGYNIIGTDENIAQYVSPNNYFLITVGQIKTPKIRMDIFEKLKKINANLAIVVSPRAYVSKYANILEGTIILHDALVNANAQIGMNTIINTKSLIEHDAIIGNHCHISTGTVVNGGCKIEDETFIGSNTVLQEGIFVPTCSVISAGSFFRGK
jgi:sugar O-acyltransferase (sialic acid O-acetyltransferase NeuD family)